MPQAKRRWSARLGRVSARPVDLVLAVLVTFAGLLLFAFSGIGGNRRAGFLFLQNVELRTLDLRFALRGTRPHDDRIVIVGIDERTLQKLGSFPLPRKSYARLVQSLADAGARVIAFDATFPTPESNSGLEALRKLQAEIGPGAPPSLVKEIQGPRNCQRSGRRLRGRAEAIRQRRAGTFISGRAASPIIRSQDG